MDLSETSLLLCCGGKKCPTISANPDGSFAISDEAEGCPPIRLSREQAALMLTWLGTRLRAPAQAAE